MDYDRFFLQKSEANYNLRHKKSHSRPIETNPIKILDAPGMVEKENLLDWQNNTLGIALYDSTYIYNIDTKEVTQAFSSNNYISSLKIHENLLFSGDSVGNLSVLDIKSNKEIFKTGFPKGNIVSMDVLENVLSLSLKDSIVSLDLRSKEIIKSLEVNEVMKIKYSHDRRYLAMVGDGVQVYDLRCLRSIVDLPILSKSVDWCSWRYGIICIGDYKNNKLMIYDALDRKEEKSITLGARIHYVKYVYKTKEILVCTGDGKRGENSVSLYKGSNLMCVSEFGKHEFPVCNAAISSDEDVVCSVSSDESLKFWRIIEAECKFKKDSIDFR